MMCEAAGRSLARRMTLPAGFLLGLAMLGSAGASAAPLSLDECIELALRDNPGLASTRYDLKGVEGNRLSASGAFLPSISLQSGYIHSERGRGVIVIEGTPFHTRASKDEFYSIRSSISQNIVDLPSLYRYGAAGADITYYREHLRVARADLIYNVRQQYYLLLKAVRLAQVAKDALAVSEEQLRKSEALFELGSVARTDVLQARVNRATAVQEEISARNQVDQEKANLAVLLGLRVDVPLEIRLDLEEPVAEIALSEEALIEQAQRDLPEVHRARAQMEGASLRKSAAFWEQFPSLGASLSYTKQSEKFGDVVDLDNVQESASWGFSIGFSWNIFDGLGTIGSIRTAKANLAAAREANRQVELEAALAAREAHIAINNAQEGIRAAGESVRLAEENLKLQQALYENGGGTILELNNAQVDSTRARNSLVEAQIGLRMALAQLDRALGR